MAWIPMCGTSRNVKTTRIDAWMTNMSMTEDSFNRLQDIIENAGELTRRAKLSELVINDYAEEAYRDIYG